MTAPDAEADERTLVELLAATTGEKVAVRPAVLSATDVLEMRALVRSVPIGSELLGAVARLVRACDPRNERAPDPIKSALRFGASPRGAQALVLLAKARALVHGRPWVAEEDLEALAAPALRHRLVFSYEGEASGVHPDDLVRAAWKTALRG